MYRVLLVFLWVMVGLSASAVEPDTLTIDTVSTDRQMGVIRRTVREFDRLDDEYIEPNHYEPAARDGKRRWRKPADRRIRIHP